jgi:hypothetical protein
MAIDPSMISPAQVAKLAELLDKFYYSYVKTSYNQENQELDRVKNQELDKLNLFINNFIRIGKSDDVPLALMMQDKELTDIISGFYQEESAEHFGLLNPEFKKNVILVLDQLADDVQQLKSEAREYEKLLEEADHEFNLSEDPIRAFLRTIALAFNPISYFLDKLSFIFQSFRKIRETEHARWKRTDILAKLNDLRNKVRLMPTTPSNTNQTDPKSDPTP